MDPKKVNSSQINKMDYLGLFYTYMNLIPLDTSKKWEKKNIFLALEP